WCAPAGVGAEGPVGCRVSGPEFGKGAIGRARCALYEALVPLLDEGRVQPYDDAVPTTPCITIGKARLGYRSISQSSQATVATFPVVIRVDGSKLAALRQLDELAAEVWTRGNRLNRVARSVSSNPSTSDAVGSGTSSTQTHTV